MVIVLVVFLKLVPQTLPPQVVGNNIQEAAKKEVAKRRDVPHTVVHKKEQSTIEVATSYGRVLVVVDKPLHVNKSPKVVTLHAAGWNSALFANLVQLSGSDEGPLGQATFYHINLPGHFDSLQELKQVFTMEEWTACVCEVLDELKIGAFVGVGVQAGANLFLRLALKRQRQIRALILFRPDYSLSSLRELTTGMVGV